MNFELQRKPKLASMSQVEALMALRNMKSEEAQKLLDEEGKRSAWSDELGLYDKWIKIKIDDVSIDLHYGVPIHQYELMLSLEECHEYFTDGLFAGIMPDAFRDPYAFNPSDLMVRGFHKLQQWSHSLWTSIFRDQSDKFDYYMMCKRMYICLDKNGYAAALDRASHRTHMHQGFPSLAYNEMLEHRKYYYII
jgi:hypothetical protein